MAKKASRTQRDSSVETLDRVSTQEPRLFRVYLNNDDYTTMEFVVEVLIHFFRKDYAEAVKLMQEVHYKGRAMAGLYTYDVAETKVHEVTKYARQHGHPLLVTMEPDDS